MRATICLVLTGLASVGPVHAQSYPWAEVDVARVISAMEVCRAAPASGEATLDFARAQGFGDLPPSASSGPFKTLVRQDVRLIAQGTAPSMGSGGNCQVFAKVRSEQSFSEIEASLAKLFGAPGESDKLGEKQNLHWRIDGRYINVRLSKNDLSFFVGFPEPTKPQVAEARAVERQREAAALADLKKATVFSGASEFGLGASACAVALGPRGVDDAALRSEGWNPPESAQKIKTYGRTDSAIRLFVIEGLLPGGQCVVDGYAANQGQFKAIREAIRDSLRARLGQAPEMPNPPVPGGQAFVAGDLMMILSTEQRANGLSVRVSSVRLGAK